MKMPILVLEIKTDMGWLRFVGSLKLQVSFAEDSLFYRALLQKRPIILRKLPIVATPYIVLDRHEYADSSAGNDIWGAVDDVSILNENNMGWDWRCIYFEMEYVYSSAHI